MNQGKIYISIILGVSSLIGLTVLASGSRTIQAGSDDKIKICHSTSSNSNPYVVNNPDKSGDVEGHDDHDGGVYPDNPWGDIIPPFEYDDDSYPGKN